MLQDCRNVRGSVYQDNGYWVWQGKLPGDVVKHKHKLCAAGSKRALSADRPRELAVAAAQRLWDSDLLLQW